MKTVFPKSLLSECVLTPEQAQVFKLNATRHDLRDEDSGTECTLWRKPTGEILVYSIRPTTTAKERA